VFILEYYFTSKSLLLFMKAYPEKEVLNKTTIHELVTALEVVI
jgi:hypothetical protein